MLSSKSKLSRRGLLAGTIALSACGFSPLYQEQAGGNQLDKLRGKVELPPARNREGYAVRNTLARYFSEPSAPAYRLEIQYRSTVKSLAISQNSVVTRQRVTASGRYKALDLSTNQYIFDFPFLRVASYSTNSDRFAANESLVATKEALAREVADEFALKFLASLKAHNGA